jgi:hypothetical protein
MNCTVCGNSVNDLSKGCPTCGHYANSGIEYCYHCGRKNEEQYLICTGCKTPLAAKQNHIIAILLSFFFIFPFLALYAGRKKEALTRIFIFLTGVIALSVSTEFHENESTVIAIQSVALIAWGILFFWSVYDFFRIFFYWPRPYTNAQGFRIG